MKKATRKALMKSIVHWREYLVKSIGGELVYPSALECALCVKFNNSETLADPCIGCPVCQCTGRTLCRATAYYAVTDAKTPQDQQFPIAAMLQFLTGLLPERRER